MLAETKENLEFLSPVVKRKSNEFFYFLLMLVLIFMTSIFFWTSSVMANGAPSLAGSATKASVGIPSVNVQFQEAGSPGEVANVLKILILLTVLSLAPSILIMMTSFTRIVVVLSFLRQAIGAQQMPPNQLMIGLSLFLTFFVMAPTFKTIQQEALEPYMNNKMDQMAAYSKAEVPLREFMFKQTREKDIETMMSLAKLSRPKNKTEVPTYVLVPSFIISELKTSFQMGFMLYIPFLVLDMVVSSVLMAMGMMMLPPVVISLPFKILLFVLVDGWQLIVGSLVRSFS
jgi:flagellar biosynthetic protein FliP